MVAAVVAATTNGKASAWLGCFIVAATAANLGDVTGRRRTTAVQTLAVGGGEVGRAALSSLVVVAFHGW